MALEDEVPLVGVELLAAPAEKFACVLRFLLTAGALVIGGGAHDATGCGVAGVLGVQGCDLDGAEGLAPP
jgi:hypothetical protein